MQLKPLAKKLSVASLEDLYLSEKFTPSIVNAIQSKEDFTTISDRYCSRVCKYPCKDPHPKPLNLSKADVVILKSGRASAERYKNSDQVESTHTKIIRALGSSYLKGRTFKIVDINRCSPTISKGDASFAVRKKCLPYSDLEIASSDAKVILALDNESLNVVGIKASTTADAGVKLGSHYGVPVVPCLHVKQTIMIRQTSSGKLWGIDYLDLCKRAFQKAADILSGNLVPIPLVDAVERVKPRIEVVRTHARLSEIIDFITCNNLVMSYDVETTSLDAIDPSSKIIVIQLGYRNSSGDIVAAVIPMDHRENTFLEVSRSLEILKPILESDKIRKIGHNIKFDVIFTFCKYNIRLRGIILDTMLAIHSINSGMQGTYSLKFAVGDYLPESCLEGYEDLLPKLSKIVQEESEDEHEEYLSEE